MGCSTCGKKNAFLRGMHSTVSAPTITQSNPNRPKAVQGIVKGGGVKTSPPLATPVSQSIPEPIKPPSEEEK